ncbi:hypothetical protein L208DRAFT_727251 [Tricholoma matsutake]|nr:hypothetical protein L208DRAFT_727251 [Tricholoma matsutake 945]
MERMSYMYNFYHTVTLWPSEVRKDLRSGIRAKHSGDLNASEQYLQRAWTIAKSLPISVFGSEPHLKVSGIAICLASVLEQNHKPERAFEVYEEAFEMMPQQSETLSGKEKVRSVGIAYKLGEMAGAVKGKEDTEEGYLCLAVEALLKDKDDSERQTREGQGLMGNNVNMNDDAAMKMFELPQWATKIDIAAPFEALGSFYARTGRLESAMALYLHTMSILIPPPPQSSSVEDRCRGAQVMTALSDLIMRNPEFNSVSEALRQAELWSKKALDIATQHSSRLNNVVHCDAVLVAAAYNIGILKKMMGDKENARFHFEQSLKVSKMIGMQEGIQNAEEALSKVDEEMQYV